MSKAWSARTSWSRTPKNGWGDEYKKAQWSKIQWGKPRMQGKITQYWPRKFSRAPTPQTVDVDRPPIRLKAPVAKKSNSSFVPKPMPIPRTRAPGENWRGMAERWRSTFHPTTYEQKDREIRQELQERQRLPPPFQLNRPPPFQPNRPPPFQPNAFRYTAPIDRNLPPNFPHHYFNMNGSIPFRTLKRQTS